jgi:hypothetical protein
VQHSAPFCDVAAGKNFALAIDVNGVCHGFGAIVGGAITVAQPIPSLAGRKIRRVFAKSEQAMVIADRGIVLACGKGLNGVLGTGSEVNQLAFTAVAGLNSVEVVAVAMGDAHTLFLAGDGSVWGTGRSADGRLTTDTITSVHTPVRSPNIPGRATAIACGSQHSLVLVGGPANVHPGIRHFAADRQAAAPPRTLIEPISEALLFEGFMPGDVVAVPGEGEGIVAGACYSWIVVQTADRRVVAPPEKLTLTARDGFIGVQWKNRIVDGGRALELLFGLKTGDIVRAIESGREYEVAGVGAGGLCLQSVSSNETICVQPEVRRFFSAFECISCKHSEEIWKVFLPIRSIPTFWTFVDRPVEIIGEFGMLYLARWLDGSIHLHMKVECNPIEGNGTVYTHDWVVCDGELGILQSVFDGSALFLSLDALAKGESAHVVPVSALRVVATIAGPGLQSIADQEYSIKPSDSPFLAGDLVVGENGFATILGTYGDPACILATDIDDGQVFPLDPKEYKLVRRLHHIPGTLVEYGDLMLSVCVDEFVGMGCLPGDEVLFRGETPAVVAGLADSYLWVIGMDGQCFCATINDSLTRYVTFVERLTSHWKLLLPE